MLIDASLWDRVVSFDLAGAASERLAGEHDLSVAFSRDRLPGFSHALPPLPPAGVGVYGWMKQQAMLWGGVDRDPVIPTCRGRGSILAPGSGRAAKNAPLDCFLEAAASAEDPVFVLGPAESEAMEREIRSAGFPVVRPETLAELDRQVSSHAVFHGNDSGPMHLSALRGLETHLHLVDPASRDWIPPGRVVVHEVVAGG